MTKKKVELVAPGGTFLKLTYAFKYGADAVYIAAQDFSLRAKSKNFSIEELAQAVNLATTQNKKIYLALNIFAHNFHITNLKSFLQEIQHLAFTAFIIADPGILALIKEIIPKAVIHLSTQANTTNYMSAAFWKKQGVSRIVLARELTLTEIKEIKENVDIELETFIHGAMCVAYSGRCLLSKYFTDRESNLGDCSHPCRWNYSIVEEKRDGQFLPIEENEFGTEIFSSKDLCLISHIDKLIEAGIDAFKIEGRMKTLSYVSGVTRVYREAIDTYYKNQPFCIDPKWLEELNKISHRDYSTGFFFDDLQTQAQVKKSTVMRESQFLAIIKEILPETDWVKIEVRSKIKKNDVIEIIKASIKDDILTTIEKILLDGKEVMEANPNQIVDIKIKGKAEPFDLLRA